MPKSIFNFDIGEEKNSSEVWESLQVMLSFSEYNKCLVFFHEC